MTQIPLHLELRSNATFSNYSRGPNSEAVEAIEQFARGGFSQLLGIWGPRGTGKTHLLESAVRLAGELDHSAFFLPMASADALSPTLLDGLEALELVVVDDIDAIAADLRWERAFFQLYNRIESHSGHLLFTSTKRVTSSGFALPDLSSRLSSGPAFQLRELDDAQRLAAIQQRAHERGYEVTDEVCHFLLRRSPRDMHTLSALLSRIEQITLVEKRKATIPLVRRLLSDA